ncbi:FG-GAP-like repeat-containing protein [Bdellovibrio sp. HCB337]|uniref:FG-GAP-like repeat-containing protein n=1 Tax=Bdellovibrio sp. HCB337 TaxID=3394358 RepID=UPI0039A6C702
MEETALNSALTGDSFLKRSWAKFQELDPRIPVAVILFTYLALGLTVLGFNRSPLQAITTTLTCCTVEVLLTYLFKRKWVFPLSAMITSFSLSFLMNYSHDFFLLFVPIFFAIGSKYIFQFNGKHALNPAMMGISLSLLFSEELLTAAPAYQWNGIGAMSLFVIMLGIIFVIPKVNRVWLVGSFLLVFSLQTALRAWIMKHHLPFETLFLGTLSSPSFFIFTFFMITDPATSPKDRKQQIIVGALLATVDLALHLRQSYYTFFYAALIVGGSRLAINHLKTARKEGFGNYFKSRFITSKYYRQPLVLGILFLAGTTVYSKAINPHLTLNNLNWNFVEIDPASSGLNANKEGDIYAKLDPRVQHIAKWVLSVGDSVSMADFDNDGRQDVFLTNLLKEPFNRYALYRNVGPAKFERVPLPALNTVNEDPAKHGVVSNGIFSDYDNDGDQDLMLTVGFGHSMLLKNLLSESGKAEFKDVTDEVGLNFPTQSISATFADFNQDGLLDLLIMNVWPNDLPDYDKPTPLSLFHLPQPEYDGDNRMFNFMHDSWHMSNNGGENVLLLQTPDHKFEKQDSKKWGIPETRWSLAVGVVDFNNDTWPDFYVANDFGPDDLYYNHEGKYFENIKGTIFGSIGKDTYKGMNVSIADFDRTGNYGVYVSNVHHAFQAEGSLLWMFSPSDKPFYPNIVEAATNKSVLNENRFGWGASATDFDNDGLVDIAQANGMVDDTYDRKSEECPDYWYVNEKVARSPPSIHRYANRWGDIRGYCIYGHEQNRIYLNRGADQKPQFVDVATQVGVTKLTNSRGAASADFENHGRRDLIFTHPFGAATFYVNRLKDGVKPEETNAWVGFELTSLKPGCNRDAVGTQVELIVYKKDQSFFRIVQEVQVVSGFASQNDKRLHFGLGQNVDHVNANIKWCGREPEKLENIKTNAYNKVVLKNESKP